MSATSDARTALRATLRFLGLALLALAGTATAQTPPYQINAYNSPTTVTVHEGQTFNPIVRVTDGFGAPVQGWSVDWAVAPSGSITTPTTTSTSGPSSVGGITSNSFTNYVSGTYTISATTFDGEVIILKDDPRVRPAGTAGPVTFTVNVENVGMLHFNPSTGTDTVLTNATRQLQVYWGSASLPKAGTTLQWSIVSEPAAGAGTVDTSSVTDASGLGTVNFSGAVAGNYTIRAQEFGCTWCGPTSRDFVIAVADPTADVHAILSDAPDPVDPGATISYSIGVGNNGPEAAANASFSIATPADTVFESFAPAAGWSCSTPAAGATGTITCSQASLASGTGDLFDLVVRVGNPAAGTIINASVNITTSTTDTDSTNNDAATDTTVATLFAWTFAKSLVATSDNDSSGSVTVGDQLDYQLVATNTGNTPLTNVLVNDDLIGGGPVACPTLAVGAQCVLASGYIVTAADEQAGQVVNTGSATSDQIPGPATDTVTTPVVLIPAPGLDLVKLLAGYDDVDGSGDVTEGDTLHYQITATNTGNVPLTNLLLSDDHFANTQTCASVPVAGTCVLTGDYLVTGADRVATQVVNTASALPDEFSVPTTTQLTTIVAFHPAPSMTIAKARTSTTDNDGSGTVTEGDVIHYTVTATNTGNVTLLNLQIDDAQLAPSFEVCSGVSPGGTCLLNGDHVVTRNDALAGQVVNTATAISAELPTPQSSNTVTTAVAGTPGMAIAKALTGSFDMDGSGDVSLGDELYYDVTVTNTGTTELHNVVVSDDHYGGTQACAQLFVGNTCVLNVIYTVQMADALAGQVVNTGSAVSDQFPSGMSASVTTPVAAAPPTLNIVSGDGAAGYGGQSAQLVVSLFDAGGNPMVGATITWSGAANGTTTVQADGTSTNTVNFNGTTGFFTVTAAYLPASLEVQFTVQSVSATLAVASGNLQSGPAGTTLPDPIVVFATDDGAPASTAIVWTVTGDATVSPTSNATDIDGLAGTMVTFGPTQGPVQVQAQRPDSGETAVFDLTATAPVRTLAIHDGNFQSGPPGATLPLNLVVEAQDNGVGVDGVVIEFSVIGGSDAIVGTCCGTTAGGGFAGTSLTLRTTPGPVQMRAQRQDDPSVFVVFDATAQTRGLGVVSGDNQSAPTGSAHADPLVVQATLDGTAEEGITIAWTTNAASATVAPVINPTDTSGQGSAQVTCGATAETFIVTAARFDDPSLQVSFTATCTVTRDLFIEGGNNQAGPTGTTLPIDLAVRALDNGNPVSNVDIRFMVISGTATVSPTLAPTDVNGIASTTLTFGTTPGQVVVRATRGDDPLVHVDFVATAQGRGLVETGGQAQTATLGQALPAPLQVQSRLDTSPEPGVALTWSTTADLAVVPVVNPTDGNGDGSAQVTCGTIAGSFNVTAARVDDPGVSVQFFVTCTQPVLTIVSGANQTGLAGTAGAQPLVVELRDGSPANNLVANATIYWNTVAGGATADSGQTTTGPDGRATNTFHYGAAGVSTLKAHDGGFAAVDFTVTALAPTVVIVSGNDQAASTGAAFAAPLVVQALNDGAPAANVTIAWDVPTGDATVSLPTTQTDANGFASVTLQAGATAGTVTITATRLDDPAAASVAFAATVAAPTLAITGGDGQSGLTSTVADAPLQVRLLDGTGNPVGNQAIAWAAAGAGTVSAPSTLTDANGYAQVTLTFAATAGTVQVTASTAGAAPVTFNATAINPAIGIGSGNNQTGPVNTTLPLPLTVVVGEVVATATKDRVGADALDGVPVTFAVTSGGGAVSPQVVMTDATGQASTQFTLGPIEGTQTVTATVAGGASVTFTATATIARTLTLVSGDGQAAAPGSALAAPLVVHAQDNGADAAGIAINWSLVPGSAPATITPSGATTAAGLADATVTLGATPGPVSIRAERADDPTVFVVFEANTAKIQDIPGLTPEERELAIVIDETCATLAGMASLTPAQQDFLARCQELTDGSIIDPGAVTDALEQLLPGVALAMQEAAFNAAQAQFQNLKARIAALRSGTQGSSFQGLALQNSSGTVSLGSLRAALAQDEPAKPSGEAGTDFQRWGFFASGTIGRGEAEAGSTRPAYDYDINGLTVGIDYRKSDTFIFGGALGYTRQDSELRGSPGNMDMSGWSVSGYATWYRDNSWYTDAVLTYGHNNFDLLRTITYTVPLPGGGSSTVAQTARSNSDGSLLEGAFTFGRDFQAGGWSIGPYGRLLYTKLEFDRIVDEMDSGPGSGLGLEIDERSLTSLASEIGAKFTYAHSTDWGVVTPHLQLEWEHEFKDDPRALTARFLADPNRTPFTLSGEEIDTDFFRVSVGLSVIMQRGKSGFLIYERTVGRDGFFQDNLGFGLRIEF